MVSAGVTGPDAVREVLETTAEDRGPTGWDEYYGWGIVDAYGAVDAALVPNTAPVADADGPYSGTEKVAFTFDGSGSYDPDGDPLTYLWDFGDGTTGSGVSPSHTYEAGGAYTVTLVVNDGRADSEPATTTADIAQVNDAPVAEAGPDQSGYVGEALTFDGAGSYDEEDGTALVYQWEFGDAASASGVTAQHAYAAAGTYVVTLTVTGSDEASDTDTATVDVQEEPAGPAVHVADIEMSLQSKGPNWEAQALVTVVEGDGAIVKGAAVTGDWALNGGYLGTTTENTTGQGQARLRSPKVGAVSGDVFTFTVTGVDQPGSEYDPGANAETSDSIVVP